MSEQKLREALQRIADNIPMRMYDDKTDRSVLVYPLGFNPSHIAREALSQPQTRASFSEGRLMTNEQKLREALDMALRALDDLSVPSTYEGERTGGVLKGCPRGPAPTPQQLATRVRIVNDTIRSMVGLPRLGEISPQPTSDEGTPTETPQDGGWQLPTAEVVQDLREVASALGDEHDGTPAIIHAADRLEQLERALHAKERELADTKSALEIEQRRYAAALAELATLQSVSAAPQGKTDTPAAMDGFVRVQEDVIDAAKEVQAAFSRLCVAKIQLELRDDLKGDLQMDIRSKQRDLDDALVVLNQALAAAPHDVWFRDIEPVAKAASDKLDRAGYYDEATLIIQLLNRAAPSPPSKAEGE